eukprot:TRINITY_DN779854_c0_g1_i1.p1 TRINITY_DN779854_c0_g1~~TRINITY_DN779854_c0_g1_i1.p1  ORF type:complete len:469 (+),score=137.60 TRINITY_DN779854_c0_g1_i1:109-1515(+)
MNSPKPKMRGFYADPKSPIASSPQRRMRSTKKVLGPSKLSQMIKSPALKSTKPTETPNVAKIRALNLKRKPDCSQDGSLTPPAKISGKISGRASWKSTLFSPMLQFFGNNKTKSAPSSTSTTPSSSNEGSLSTGTTIISEDSSFTPEELAKLEALAMEEAELQDISEHTSSPSSNSDSTSSTPSTQSISNDKDETTEVTNDQSIVNNSTVEQDNEDCDRIDSKIEEIDDEKVDEEVVEEEDDEIDEFNPYYFIKMLPAYNSLDNVPPICLPPKAENAPELTLVLDLDETLVHCTVEPIEKPDLQFTVTYNETDYNVFVLLRPYFKYFLETVSQKYEVVLFTASQQVYAERLLQMIDPDHKFTHHRLYRDSCLCVDGNYLKDLNALGRDLKKTVIVDNSPHAFGYQVENGIPIISWFDDKKDCELLRLMPFLEQLEGKEDVRPLVREKFQLHRLIKNSKMTGYMSPAKL